MPRTDCNGISLYYELSGPAEAPVVTLSHSLSCDLTMWDPQTAALEDAGYRVLRYDTRGHGRTEAPPGPYSLGLLAEDAAALLAALEVERTHFVGLSLGGMIAQTLALEHPALLYSLALCDTTAALPPEALPIWDERIETARTQGMAAHVEPTIGRWFTEPFIASRADAVDPIRALIAATRIDGYIGCVEAIKGLDLLERLPAVQAPTLVVVGADDPGTTPEAARAISERIPGATLVVIESASHLSNVEQPEAFNAALLEFLAKVAG